MRTIGRLVDPLRWAILALAVAYRVALYYQLRGNGFFRLRFVDTEEFLDLSSKYLRGELPSPLFKAAHWFIVMEALLQKLGWTLDGLHALQYLGGILVVLVVLTLGSKAFGRWPASIAGAVLAVYGPSLFQESQLIPTVWASLFLTMSVLLVITTSSPNPAVLLLSGIIFGLGIQSQANMALAAGAFFLGIFLWSRGKERRRAILLFPVGAILAIAPLTLHNLQSGEFLPLSASGGINLFIGNGPQADGSFELPKGYSIVNEAVEFGPSTLSHPSTVLGRPTGYSGASRFWTLATLEHMAANPAAAMLLFGKKALLLVQSWEVVNNFSYRVFRKSFVSLPLPLDFGILFSFAIPGVLLAARQSDKRPLIWALGGYAVSVILVFVVDRYRMPLVPLTALLAGAGACHLCKSIVSGGKRLGQAAILVLVGVALVLTHIPGWTSVAREEADSWTFVGKSRFWLDDPRGARDALEKALAAFPRHRDALVALASLEAIEGAYANAEALYRRALEVEPGNAEIRGFLGRVLIERGDMPGALALFRSALAASPRDIRLHIDTARTLVELGRPEEAERILALARSRGLGSPELVLLADRILSGRKGMPK